MEFKEGNACNFCPSLYCFPLISLPDMALEINSLPHWFVTFNLLTDIFTTQQIVGGSEHTLRAKLTFSQESHGRTLLNT